MLTWLLGLPSSSSHALFGGLIGAVWVAAGADAVKFGAVFSKVILPAIFSPLVAGLIALIATFLAYRITTRAAEGTVTRGFKVGQIVSASMVALAHGTNDAQKTMGVITLTLITAGAAPPDSGPPFWVILSRRPGHRAGHLHRRLADHPDPGQAGQRDPDPAGLRRRDQQRGHHPGLLAPGLRALHHPGGHRLDLRRRGRPAARRVQWGVAGQMAVAWLLTLPAAAAVGAVAGWLAGTGTVGTIIVALVAVAIGGGIYAASRRRPVTADNVNDVPAPTPVGADA